MATRDSLHVPAPAHVAAVLLFALMLALPAPAPAADEDEDDATSADAKAPGAAGAPLVDPTGRKTTFAGQFGDGHKVILFTKPWSDTNAQLIGELSHFHIRLNRGGLKSGVVFLRSDAADAARAMKGFEGRVKYVLDQDGTLARLLRVHTCPALLLVDPDGRVRYSTPLLAQDLVRQVAAHYNQPEKMFHAPSSSGLTRRPGIPPPAGNTGQSQIQP